MKTLPALTAFLYLSINIFLTDPSVEGQAVNPGTAPVLVPSGGFAIDGDLQANTPAAGIGDWLPGAAGSGGYVMDTTGKPLNAGTTFHLIDAYGSNDNTFGGGAKADDNPNSWTWSLGSANSKTDINNVLIHFALDAKGHQWVIVAADRLSNSGEAWLDFEFLQDTLTVNSNGTFYSAGPNGGRTAGDFDLTFSTGGNFTLETWQLSGSSYTYVTYAAPAGTVYGANNTAAVPVSFGAFGSTTYPAGTFTEGAVDITSLLGTFNPCIELGIKTIFVKSKTSASTSASITDFVTPIQVSKLQFGIAVAGPNQSLCSQGASTSFTLSGNAASSPGDTLSTITWSVTSGTATITNASSLTTPVQVSSASATLRLTVTTKGGCTAVDSLVLTVKPLPSASISGASSTCNGSPVTLTASTGATNPTYLWSNGGTTSSITVSPSSNTTYSVAITDGVTGCTTTSSGTTVSVNPLPTAIISGTTAVCQNAATPNITFTGANGTAPYTFTYKINGGSNQLITTTSGSSVTVSAPTGSSGSFVYSLVSVKDASSTACSQSQSGSVTITVNPLPTAVISGTTAVCQNAASPNVTFTGANGTAPYTFTYKINGGSNQTVTTTSGNSVTVAVPTGLPGSFIYTLVSVQDASSTTCSQSQSGSATITVNPLPTAGISGTTAVCQNAGSPNVTFTGANGTTPYTFTYKINGGSNQTVTTTSGNAVTVSAPTGTSGTFIYTLVSVQDASSTTCSQAQGGSVTITVNPLPTATINGTIAICQNASSPNVTFTGANGTAPYTFTYKINGGSNQAVTTSSGNSVTVAAPTATPGTFVYTLVSVQDASSTSCSQSQSGSVAVTINPLPIAIINGTIAVCQNAPSPNITFTGANGTAPYTFTYKINGGSNKTVTTTSGNSVTVAVTTSSSGTFTYSLVSVQDASSTTCSQSQSGSATVTVNPSPSALISGTTTVCQNAASPNVTFTGSNGTAPYTFAYNINGGANQIVTTASGNSVTVAAPTGAAGSFIYTLTGIQDGSSTTCSQSQLGTVTITINPLPTAGISGITSVCQNASSPNVTFTGANGTAPYTFTYKINSGSNKTVTTASGNSVSVAVPTGSSGSFVYTLVSVQDASSTTCSQSQSGSVTVIVNPLPTASIGGTTAVCQNASSPNVTFTGANGTSPYTFSYTINGGSLQSVTTTSGNSVTVTASTGTPGTYTYTLVSVQDASSTTCSQTQSGSVTVTINPLPTGGIRGSTAVCQNASSPNIIFTGGNGTAPYTFTYKINGGSNQTVTTISGNSVAVSSPTGASGTFVYTLVSVQDASSTACSQPQSGSVTIIVNPLPVAVISGSTALCQNSSPPNVTFTGANGTSPYTFTYKINGGSNQTVTTSSGNSVTISVPTGTPGTYIYSLISVQDASSTACTQAQSGSATVTVNPGLAVNINPPSVFLCEGTSVSLCANSTGSSLSYKWSNGLNTACFIATSSNTYSVTVTDGNTSCTGTASVNVSLVQPPLVKVTASGSTTICNGDSVTLTASGAANYLWNTGSTGTSIVVKNDGLYRVTGSNVANCSIDVLVYVTVNPSPVVTITPSGSTSFCQGGSVTLNASGAATYIWSNGGTALAINAGTQGTYTVTGTDGNGCKASASRGVTVNPLPNVTFSNISPVCVNGGPIDLNEGSPLGGTYSGQGIKAASFDPIVAGGVGNYVISYFYTDGNGCSNSASSTITVLNVTRAPGAISGPIYGVCVNTSKGYSITPVNGATSYTWTAPANAGITAGQGTTSVVVSFNGSFSSGTLSVQANGTCGSSSSSMISIASIPSTPPVVFGNPEPCKREYNLYWVNPVPGASNYSWNVPPGSFILSGQGTDSVAVRSGNKSGDVTVIVSNACGTSGGIAVLTTNVTCRTADPTEETAGNAPDLIMTAYPNPTQDYLNVIFTSSTEDRYILRMYDMTGRLVHDEETKAQIGDNLIKINLNVAAGLYIVSLSSGDLNKQLKIIVQ